MSDIRTLPAQLLHIDPRSIPEIEQEIVDELNFHIAMRTADNVRVGMSAEAAHESALTQFGDFTAIHQKCRHELLGERIMWQRLQMLLTVALLAAVVVL